MAPSFEEWIPRIDDDVFIIPPRLRNDESNFGLEPAQHRPFFGLELGADDLKLQDRVVDRDKDLVATAKEIANQYVPGEAEQAVFAATATSSSSSSGNASGDSVVARRSTRRADPLRSVWYQLPVGVFVFRNEYNTERHRHGDVYFTDDVKAADVFTLDDNTHPRPASEWQAKVEFLLIAKDFADDRNTFVPAPQAAYATGGNHSKSGPKISKVVTGSRTMRFEKIYLKSKDDAARFIWRATILMECKMPGLRVVMENQTAKHAKCHATVEVRIDGHDAEFMKVVVKDACVHRAAQIPKDSFPASA